MKYTTIFLVLCFVSCSFIASAKKKTHRIIFQFTNANDTLQQKAFVKQLENLNDVWPDANYEVVLYNQGLELVMKNNVVYADRLKALKNKGVRFVICENTLKNRKMGKDVFIQEIVEYIPAGIAEIVEKQEQGWSYVKGGF